MAQHRILCSIPTQLSENSGLLMSSADKYWMHNDGGDSAKLYQLDTFGTILRSITVLNATNIDWEDIAEDNKGNLYIGDFGNNNNQRQNLKIFKIPHPDSVQGVTVQAEIIDFYYPEQLSFPAADANKKYDAEALVYMDENLYIFTKDRTTPHQGYTWLYKIPAQTGTHAAQLIDSFATQQFSYIFEVTSAALSPDGQHLALLNAVGVWLFSNFTGDAFFDASYQFIPLNSFNQKEAVAFGNPMQLYVSNETSMLGTAQLIFVDLTGYLQVVHQTEHSNSATTLEIFPNPAFDILTINITNARLEGGYLSLFSSNGQVINSIQLNGQYPEKLDISTLPAGVYYIKLENEGWVETRKFIKL